MELHLRICTSMNKLRHFTGCLDGFVFLPCQVSQTEQVYRFKISSSGLPAKAETRHTANHHTAIPKLQALVYDILPSFGERCRKAVLGVWSIPSSTVGKWHGLVCLLVLLFFGFSQYLWSLFLSSNCFIENTSCKVVSCNVSADYNNRQYL